MSPDTYATIAAFAVVAACLLALRMVRPIGSSQPRHGAAWLDAHDVPAEARNYRPAITIPAEPQEPAPAIEDVSDTSPWAVPAVLATIPDALTIVRTA